MAALQRYGHSEPESLLWCWNGNCDHRIAVLQTNGVLNAIRNCAFGLAAAAAVALPATMMPAPVRRARRVLISPASAVSDSAFEPLSYRLSQALRLKHC